MLYGLETVSLRKRQESELEAPEEQPRFVCNSVGCLRDGQMPQGWMSRGHTAPSFSLSPTFCLFLKSFANILQKGEDETRRGDGQQCRGSPNVLVIDTSIIIIIIIVIIIIIIIIIIALSISLSGLFLIAPEMFTAIKS
ncbi:hypothetical protein QTP70_004172 [Hemibagrus guttatus]|uniref:Uncharacterized protein n=1 Tax=Hemibagrus guttatus TaxID=175788 RepID=A0AAE0RHF3_9TELE|nr:hypothetical protein QTP70_004172 [Hemibagrus guttatus]